MGTCLGPIPPCAAKIRDMPRSDAVWGPGDHEYSRRIPGRPLDDKKHYCPARSSAGCSLVASISAVNSLIEIPRPRLSAAMMVRVGCL